MKFDPEKFKNQLPIVLSPILDELFLHGFIPTLVGGSMRDFFLFGILGKDWDVELGHQTISFSKDHWKTLGSGLLKFGKVVFLPYDVIRLEVQDYHFEFSPPRIEHYHENSKGHSNFDAELILNLSFEEAVKRRDFTINSIGMRFKSISSWELLDPLDGVRHLSEKKLHPSGASFSKDPVRFLRAFRFSQKYRLHFSDTLLSELKLMHLESITASYFWSEMQKSGDPVAFLETLTQEKYKYVGLKIPVELSAFEFQKLRNFHMDTKQHESWMIALEWIGKSSKEWQSFFSLSIESSKRLAKWVETSRLFQKTLPESIQGDFEIIRRSEIFEKIFDWYFSTKHLMQKYPGLPLMRTLGEQVPEWIYLFRFEVPKEVKHIDPPLRAKYQVWNLCQRL